MLHPRILRCIRISRHSLLTRIAIPCSHHAVKRGFVTESIQQIILNMHEWTGFPWWLCIASSSIGLRLLLLPTVTRASVMAATRLQSAAPDVRQLNELLRTKIIHTRKKESGRPLTLDDLTAPEVRPLLRSYFKGLRSSLAFSETPVLPLIAYPLINGITWISFVWSIRQMMSRGDLIDDLSRGGTLWFMDLTIADPSGILPTVAILLTSYSIHTSTSQATGLVHRRIKDFLQLGITLAAPMIILADAGIFFYWIPGTLFKIMESKLLKTRIFRKFLKIPDFVDDSLLRGEAINLAEQNNRTKRR